MVTGVGPARTSDELLASTSVLKDTDIVERLSGGLGDAASRAAGRVVDVVRAGRSRPIIRGLGAERVQVLTNGIGVVDASSASPDHARRRSGWATESRIEILRGPASPAYGGGATGGVVNVIDGRSWRSCRRSGVLWRLYAAGRPWMTAAGCRPRGRIDWAGRGGK